MSITGPTVRPIGRSLTMHRPRLGLRSFVIALALSVAPAAAYAAVDITEVESDGGLKAWLVEDDAVPIVAINFAFRGGSVQDPDGKTGLANLMTGLFDEGAGDMDADAFQEALEEAGADISFDANDDEITGSIRFLASERDAAIDLLALAVNEPRFDEEPFERIRAQIVTSIRASERDPSTIASIRWNEALYGDHPYGRRSEGTLETLPTLTRDDLHAFHDEQFAKGNLLVSVVGAISQEETAAMLDEVFGPLPQTPTQREVEPIEAKLDQTVRVDYPLPQTSIRFAFPGVERQDPEFFAAYLMNHILGGGTFSSRLYDEIRERRGLAYSVGSGLASREYSDTLGIGTATSSDRAGETLTVIETVIADLVENGATEDELKVAKDYVTGAYAINNLDSSLSIGQTLLGIQLARLPIDYIDTRTALIDAVTLEDVDAQADRLLESEPAILIVGPATAAAEAGGLPPTSEDDAAPGPQPDDRLPQTEVEEPAIADSPTGPTAREGDAPADAADGVEAPGENAETPSPNGSETAPEPAGAADEAPTEANQ